MLILPLMLLSWQAAKAQGEVPFSHYWEIETYFNPATAGKQNMLNLNAAYTSDFSNNKHNPTAAFVNADMPIDMLLRGGAVGINMTNNEIGQYRLQRWAAQYAQQLKIGKGSLRIGLQMALFTAKLKGDSISTDTDSGDDNTTSTTTTDAANSSVSGNALDIAVGIYYSNSRWYAGASVQHLNSPTANMGDEADFKLKPAYYFTAGYNIKLINPFITIHPSVLLRANNEDFRADITARVAYTNNNKQVYGGVAYSPDNSVTAIVGGAYKNLRVGYSYEYYTDKTNPSSGSHGFFVGYKTKINIIKKTKYKHKSVRFL